MLGSIYVDIGDALRSLMLVDDDVDFSHRVKYFIDGYQSVNSCYNLNYKNAVDSLKYITLELTLRFIIDVVEQKYFMWDAEKYKSASEHNRVRALQFWKLFNQLNKEL